MRMNYPVSKNEGSDMYSSILYKSHLATPLRNVASDTFEVQETEWKAKAAREQGGRLFSDAAVTAVFKSVMPEIVEHNRGIKDSV